LSPYLFTLVADMLQRLIQQMCREDKLHHPLRDDMPCSVLQYADDILILVRGTSEDATQLRYALDLFSNATGLRINFAKSTVVPCI
jgi:hypothetical protein